MANIEELKKRKLEQLMRFQQEKLQQQAQEQSEVQQQVEQMENIVKRLLTKEALIRYGNLKTIHHEKALHLLAVLFQAIQKVQVQESIDDATLKKILEQITPKKREIKINKV